MAVLCGMPQYSIRLKRSAVCAQAVYFLHSTIPSVTCLRLSDVNVICRVIYFQFPIQSAFLPYRSPCCTEAYLVYPIGHRMLPKIWEVRFCTPRTAQMNDFE